MSNNEAKFRLHAYRANGADANDPSFADPLAQARNDPALGAWLAREQAHASTIAGKLREITPPAGLREAILAGARASETARPSRPSFRPRWWLGAAASVALIGSAAVFVTSRARPSAEVLTTFAVQDGVDESKHGGRGDALKGLQSQLTHVAHVSASLPVDFDQLAKTGCRTLSVAGREVLEICFARDGAVFHCYISRAADFRGARTPVFEQHGEIASAAWAQGGHRFVVVTNASLDAVKRLL